MNSNDILDAIDSVDEECVKKAKEPQKKKSRKALWISMGTMAACLALAFLFPRLQNQFNSDGDGYRLLPTLTPTPTPGAPLKSYAEDTRERNNTQIMIANTAYEWPWEYRIICDQYPTVDYNGITYQCRVSHSGETLSPTWVGDKVNNAIAQGGYGIIDSSNDEVNSSIGCELYEIKGITPDRFLAVKYEGYEEYYVFMQNEYNPPATLGDLINDLNLPETFPFTVFSTTDSGLERYGITEEGSKRLWDWFSSCSAAATLSNEPGADGLPLGETVITYTVDAEALGVSNLSWRLTSGGYLCTNIENYGYYYYLDTGSVDILKDLTLYYQTMPPESDNYVIIGEITAIADRFIVVSDKLCMKHSYEGKEFTIMLDDIRLKRYLLCDLLSVGQHVLIRYTGQNGTDSAHITTAYELNIGTINDYGTILIPE